MPAADNIQFASDTTLQNAAASPGNGTAQSVGGCSTATLEVTANPAGSVFSLVPEGEIDGTTFTGLLAINLASGVVGTSISAPGKYIIPLVNIGQLRARISAITSGNVTATSKASSAPSPFIIVTAPGSASPVQDNIAQVGGAAIALGQTTMAASLPFVLASNHPSIPTTGAADVTQVVSISNPGVAVQIACTGLTSVSVVLTGTWTGVITPEVSVNGGTTWAATQFYNPATQQFSATVSANGTYQIVGTGGCSHAHILATTLTTGTLTGTLRASAQAGDTVAAQLAPSGQALAAASVSTVQATDAYATPKSPPIQPAGGTGPISPVPVLDERVVNALMGVTDVLRELVARLDIGL